MGPVRIVGGEVRPLMRVETVDLMRVAFGAARWGGPLVVVPILPGSTISADRIQCCIPPHSAGVDCWVSTPLHVLNPDQSLTSWQAGDEGGVREHTIRGEAALDAWRVWCTAVGVTDVRR